MPAYSINPPDEIGYKILYVHLNSNNHCVIYLSQKYCTSTTCVRRPRTSLSMDLCRPGRCSQPSRIVGPPGPGGRGGGGSPRTAPSMTPPPSAPLGRSHVAFGDSGEASLGGLGEMIGGRHTCTYKHNFKKNASTHILSQNLEITTTHNFYHSTRSLMKRSKRNGIVGNVSETPPRAAPPAEGRFGGTAIPPRRSKPRATPKTDKRILIFFQKSHRRYH